MVDTFVRVIRKAIEEELDDAKALRPDWWAEGSELGIELSFTTEYFKSFIEFLSKEAADVPFVKEFPLPGESKTMFIFSVTRQNELTIRQWLAGLENRDG